MDIEQFLAQIRERAWNTATLGRQFELIVKAFLKTEPLYANLYTDVWMWDECPYVLGRDTGMDLVARDIHGDFTGIQCKCYRPGTRVEKPDVDTFLSVLGSSVSVEGEKLLFRHGLYVVTNEDISDNARAALDGFRVPVNLMTLSVLRNSTIDWAHFNFGKTAKRVERHHEREHQKRAIKDVLDGFKTEERGQLIMACGTGKTFTALKITERMLAEKEKPSVLFLVPSIALLGQTLREWTAQAERPIFPVAVCSDPKASRKLSDDEQEAQGDGTASLGFPATTDSEKIRRFVKLISSRGKDGVLVFLSPRKSTVEVVQAVGRVMRKDPKGKKKLGYVILPMMVPDGEDVSTVLDMNERYKVVWAEDIARVVHAQITRFTLEGIPAKAHEYVFNGRSALEWIIDRYQIRTDKDSGITNDPNDWGREHGNPRYIVDLIQSVTTVSVKTVDLVKKLKVVKLREQNSGQDLQAGVRAANPVRNSEVLREIGEALKFREYLPVYSFKAACGPLAGGQEVEVEGWIKVEGHGKLDPTQFVVRTEGVSMEGLIPEGAMCIMRKLGGGGLEGKTILVQRNDVSDPEGGGAYTIKTFTRKGKKVVLKAKDSTYDISLKGDAEYSQKYRAIAEFKGVL